MAVSEPILLQGLQAVLVLLLAPLLTGMVRRSKARLQRRTGPGILQPYRDLARLLRKEAVVSRDASWIFTAAPYAILAATWAAAALVPTFTLNLALAGVADLVAIVGLLASARFALVLAGLDAGTAFGGLGASRELLFATVAEPAMLILIFALSLAAGTTQAAGIAAAVLASTPGLHISLLLTFVGLAMLAVIENGRIPVDNPATHLELTMVHEAMVLEYSGRHLALIEMAQFLKLLLFVSLISSVFLPWGLAPAGGPPWRFALALALYLVKLVAAARLLALFETAIAKMRVFRVPQFIGVALMLGMLAVLLLFASRSM